MQRWLWRALSVCSTVLLVSGTAFAEPSCPEGMKEFVNSETQERVCIPANVQQTPVEQQAVTPPDENAATEAVPEKTAASDTSQNVQVQDNPEPASPSSNSPEQNAVDSTNANVNSSAVNDNNAMKTSVGKSRKEAIHDSIMRSGISFEFGMGYGFLANLDIHVAGGYQFRAGDSIATFGLYLDMNLKPGVEPYFAIDMTLDPTMHISKGRFRFGFGLGLGVFISKKGWVEDLYYYDYEYKEKEYDEYIAAFELKPRLSFDWFLSTQGYVGASIDIPMVVSDKMDNNIAPMVNIDAHIGCKF